MTNMKQRINVGMQCITSPYICHTAGKLYKCQASFSDGALLGRGHNA